MTKSELIARIARLNPHLYQSDAEKIVSAVFNAIAASLAKGQRIELRGFGVFSVRTRNARAGRNPRTGEKVSVEAKNVPFFKAGKKLKDRMNAED